MSHTAEIALACGLLWLISGMLLVLVWSFHSQRTRQFERLLRQHPVFHVPPSQVFLPTQPMPPVDYMKQQRESEAHMAIMTLAHAATVVADHLKHEEELDAE